MPLACSASTWSFIKAIRGETTTVKPDCASAGNWKQSDLPPPVGSSANTSRLASASRMISSCNGRKEVNPKCCFNKDCNGAASAFITSQNAEIGNHYGRNPAAIGLRISDKSEGSGSAFQAVLSVESEANNSVAT